MSFYSALRLWKTSKIDTYEKMKAAFSASNIKHLHISDVQVGPDFIQRHEPQFAGIQDELQLFNGYPVLLPVAPGHIFPSRELLQQTPTQFLQLVPNASSVSQHEQPTERHQQVVVWMQPSSKISSVFSMCSLHVELFNIVLLLISVHSCTLSNHWGQGNQYVCYLLCTHKGSQCWIKLKKFTRFI